MNKTEFNKLHKEGKEEVKEVKVEEKIMDEVIKNPNFKLKLKLKNGG